MKQGSAKKSSILLALLLFVVCPIAVCCPALCSDCQSQEAVREICGVLTRCIPQFDPAGAEECYDRYIGKIGSRTDEIEEASRCAACLQGKGCEEVAYAGIIACEAECPYWAQPPKGDRPLDSVIAAAKSNPCTAEVGRGRSEPQYVGLPGYILGTPEEEGRTIPKKTPWFAHEVVQVGPSRWEASDTQLVEHKTPVVVVEQQLKHEGHGSYSGRLVVRSKEGRRYTIGVGSFTVVPYWACPVEPSREHRPYLAEVVTEAETIRAIDRQGRWQEAQTGTTVYCGDYFRTITPWREAQHRVICLTSLRGQREPEPLTYAPEALTVIY